MIDLGASNGKVGHECWLILGTREQGRSLSSSLVLIDKTRSGLFLGRIVSIIIIHQSHVLFFRLPWLS
jgi:hypothetical protein